MKRKLMMLGLATVFFVTACGGNTPSGTTGPVDPGLANRTAEGKIQSFTVGLDANVNLNGLDEVQLNISQQVGFPIIKVKGQVDGDKRTVTFNLAGIDPQAMYTKAEEVGKPYDPVATVSCTSSLKTNATTMRTNGTARFVLVYSGGVQKQAAVQSITSTTGSADNQVVTMEGLTLLYSQDVGRLMGKQSCQYQTGAAKIQNTFDLDVQLAQGWNQLVFKGKVSTLKKDTTIEVDNDFSMKDTATIANLKLSSTTP